MIKQAQLIEDQCAITDWGDVITFLWQQFGND
jgi:hypothetical protein